MQNARGVGDIAIIVPSNYVLSRNKIYTYVLSSLASSFLRLGAATSLHDDTDRSTRVHTRGLSFMHSLIETLEPSGAALLRNPSALHDLTVRSLPRAAQSESTQF